MEGTDVRYLHCESNLIAQGQHLLPHPHQMVKWAGPPPVGKKRRVIGADTDLLNNAPDWPTSFLCLKGGAGPSHIGSEDLQDPQRERGTFLVFGLAPATSNYPPLAHLPSPGQPRMTTLPPFCTS